MNATTITALIGAITACIVAVSGLITLIVHIKNHQPIGTDNPTNSPAKTGLISPAKPPNDWR